MRRIWRIAARCLVVGLGAGVLLLLIGVVYVVSVDLPPDSVAVQTTYIYDRNEVLIAQLTNGENRESVKLVQVPRTLVDAVIAAEDRRFYEHSGVDPIGIARALLQDLRRPRRRQGGSTITQQYVKNVYVGRELTFRRKLREAAMAVKLERKLSKDQILERYLNTIYFGRGAYGVQVAAQAYFGKDVAQLDLAECAYLAALIRGPESTDALRNEVRARTRRDSVLDGMVGLGSITVEQADQARTQPLTGPNGVIERIRRTAYTRPEAGAEFFVDLVKRDLVARYGEALVSAGGLRVKTTLDLHLQARSRRALFTTMLPSEDDPDAAVVTLNHRAEVLVLIGGRDFTRSQVNLAVGPGGGGKGRAAGSTFKPFVAATMLREGYSMESAFKAPASISIPGADVGATTWNVSNYENRAYPTMNVSDALRQSVNTVFAQIVTSAGLGAQQVVAEAEDLGVTSPLQAVGSIALGTQNVGPLEMADAYLTFANRGMRTDPRLVLSVSDGQGRKLRVRQNDPERVMREGDADVINRMLQRVVDDGTGAAAAVEGLQIAGKTGTTNDYNDAWFVGYTPPTVEASSCCSMAVWMGYADGGRAMTGVHGRNVTGGSYPAELFSRILRAAVDSTANAVFAPVERYRGKLLGGARRSIAVDAPSAGNDAAGNDAAGNDAAGNDASSGNGESSASDSSGNDAAGNDAGAGGATFGGSGGSGDTATDNSSATGADTTHDPVAVVSNSVDSFPVDSFPVDSRPIGSVPVNSVPLLQPTPTPATVAPVAVIAPATAATVAPG